MARFPPGIRGPGFAMQQHGQGQVVSTQSVATAGAPNANQATSMAAMLSQQQQQQQHAPAHMMAHAGASSGQMMYRGMAMTQQQQHMYMMNAHRAQYATPPGGAANQPPQHLQHLPPGQWNSVALTAPFPR